MSDIAILAAGAAAAGFINGLAGFGTALFALGFWLQIMPPVQAVALSVAVSLVTGAQGLWLVRREIGAKPSRFLRFLVPALVGLPLGFAALAWIDPGGLKLLIALIMLTYALFFLVRRSLPKFERPTPIADMAVGLAGGVLGGLAGLSGALPAMWCAMRPWPRAETRAVLQPFNVTTLFLVAMVFAIRGVYSGEVLQALPLVIIVALCAAQIGIFTFKRITDQQFRWLVIVLLLISGATLLLRELT